MKSRRYAMQKVVIDTNVMVSSLIQKNYPYKIIYFLFLANKIQLCVSNELLTEYYQVLFRPKFSKYPDFIIRAERLLADIEVKALKIEPQNKFDLIKDQDDNMILELAYSCNANFIITGNTNDFNFVDFFNTKIVSPSVYWELYSPS